eukprot:symbB.v1.2.001173.t1/scaffold60.1/size581591/13
MNSPSNASTETIWVGMRLRPLVERERGQPHCLRIEGPEVHVVEDALDSERRMDVHRASFAFDVAMDSTDPNSPDYVSQEKCYEIMGGRMVEHLKQGFNTCLFCYGQTGTGKTTTIMGSVRKLRKRFGLRIFCGGEGAWWVDTCSPLFASMIRGTGGMMTQAEEGMKLFEAQLSGAAAEVDKDAAGKYKNDVEARIASLEAEAALLTGKDKKKERAAKGKEVAELKGEQQYVDACKVVKGLEPKFGYFVTKAAEAPKAPEKVEVTEEIKPEKAKKDSKKEVKKESAGLSPAETKEFFGEIPWGESFVVFVELEDLKQQIIERKAILKEQGMSGGQQNKDEEIVKMVARMNDLKEKQDPGSTKKEKDDKKGSKKKLGQPETFQETNDDFLGLRES